MNAGRVLRKTAGSFTESQRSQVDCLRAIPGTTIVYCASDFKNRGKHDNLFCVFAETTACSDASKRGFAVAMAITRRFRAAVQLAIQNQF
jgi:hypothetical protein